jgi:hypothetical protein
MVRLTLSTGLLVLWLACGCGAATTPRKPGDVVRWVNRPLPVYVAPEPKPVVYPTSAPACHATQLRVRQGRTAVGLGNRLEELVFRNAGDTACLLRGYPAISGENAAGKRELLHPTTGGTYFGRLVSADLQPGDHVFLDFGTADGTGCDNGPPQPFRYRRLAFTLPRRGGTVRGDTTTIDSDCSLAISDFGLPERVAEPKAAPGSAGTLRARLQLPTHVSAGTMLRYTVTLANLGRTTVELSNCPGYTESLVSEEAARVRRSFALNCEAAGPIPPRGRVRFEMRLAVPRQAGGFAKLAWSLDTPTGPSAAAAVQIRAG